MPVYCLYNFCTATTASVVRSYNQIGDLANNIGIGLFDIR